MDISKFEIKRTNENQHNLAIIFCLVGIIFLLMAPIISLFFTGGVLLNIKALPKRARWFLSFVLLVSLSMITGSRQIFDVDSSNDIYGYYDLYQALLNGKLYLLTNFGGGLETGEGGVEVGLPILMYLFALFLPDLTVNGLMFFLSFSSALLLTVWVEKTYYATNCVERPALIGISIIFINLYFATQLSRQFLSLVVLLYAFSANGCLRQWIYVACAAVFHLTAIPFYILYRILKIGFIGWVFVIVMVFAVRVFFFDFLVFFDIFPVAVVEKLRYFNPSAEGFQTSDIASLRMILLLFFISLTVLIVINFKPTLKLKSWLVVPSLAAIIHIILLPIPSASLRMTLLVHSILPGVIVYKMTEWNTVKVANLRMLLLNFLLLYKVVGYVSAENSGSLFSTIHMLNLFFI